jgi:hypothetical protein
MIPTRLACEKQMLDLKDTPSSEHELYLKLFITNGGGW